MQISSLAKILKIAFHFPCRRYSWSYYYVVFFLKADFKADCTVFCSAWKRFCVVFCLGNSFSLSVSSISELYLTCRSCSVLRSPAGSAPWTQCTLGTGGKDPCQTGASPTEPHLPCRAERRKRMAQGAQLRPGASSEHPEVPSATRASRGTI